MLVKYSFMDSAIFALLVRFDLTTFNDVIRVGLDPLPIGIDLCHPTFFWHFLCYRQYNFESIFA